MSQRSEYWRVVHDILAREVPELAEGALELRAVARLPGRRTKVAVSARAPEVHALDACTGPLAERATAIRAALGGEALDVLLWSENPEQFVKAALAPALVQSVQLDWSHQRATAFVARDQFEHARGEAAENQVLASELTGWDIEVVPDEAV